MTRADRHPYETERLARLSELEIIGSGADPEFDALTRIASEVCRTPVALVSLVESQRQWFKSRQGLDIDETPISQSICAWTILQDGVLEITDTAKDPRTLSNALCMGDRPFRFYAGAPIVDPATDLPLGSFCVLDYQPRELSASQKRLLVDFANQAMRLIELRRAVATANLAVQETNHRVKNSLQSVSAYIRLQRRVLQGASPEAEAALTATETRIASAAALHEALCYSAVGEKVDLPGYAARIFGLATADMREGISTRIDLAACQVSSRQASALGTILSESVSNSIRHAFGEAGEGLITLTGRHEPDGRYRMEFADTGAGLPNERPAPRANGGLGLSILEGALAQLGAEGVAREGDAPGFHLGFVFTPE
ncbi:histidine kinase dimerization/phosphoacceptor domain -containing protein [Wenxinia saemankumensis]|uniref:Two-component sensor histidine kinase, contains HisKA and HATPase domains n=1 Tax=Wenxinia saemankumensis TaxID=1447782 RepID=A0A1M6EAL8_9RHOB|nr:histidine kinase dimerization/phosphoacceptor domain -containing protein [Wenxinia saemankumensis]SHI82390.1 Two-component sensor histidine kinase, contains HisKA and HATPase domains [Wenxinia saemankumensis]